MTTKPPIETQSSTHNPIANDEIAIEFVREALEQVAARGYPLDQLLKAAKIPPESIANNDAVVSTSQFARLWHLVAVKTGDEFFLLDPRGMPRGSYTMISHAVLHSPTLERALRRALRLIGILLSDLQFTLERINGDAEVVLVEKGPPRPAFAYGTIIVLLLGLACWLVDHRIPLRGVELRSPAPKHPERYPRLLHEDLRFDRPATKIRFDASYLDLAPNRTEDQMRRFLRDAPEGFLVPYKNRDSVYARVWGELRLNPPEDWPTFEQLAQKLFIASSTLRRRLEEEDTSYQKIKDDVRRERAIRQLQVDTKSNSEIAAELGFRDPSNFYRAFKKWTGGRPVDFRPAGRASRRDSDD